MFAEQVISVLCAVIEANCTFLLTGRLTDHSNLSGNPADLLNSDGRINTD